MMLTDKENQLVKFIAKTSSSYKHRRMKTIDITYIDMLVNIVKKITTEVEELRKTDEEIKQKLIDRDQRIAELESDLFEHGNNYIIRKSEIRKRIEELKSLVESSKEDLETQKYLFEIEVLSRLLERNDDND